MAAFDNFDKARRIADNAYDIAKIQRVINNYKQGRGIDRQKVLKSLDG